MASTKNYDIDAFDEYISAVQLEGAAPAVPKGASLWTLFLLSMPVMIVQVVWALQWQVVIPWLTTLLPHYAVELANIISPATGILIAPTVGVLSDRCTSSWGRRRPFIAVGAIGASLTWICFMYIHEICEFLGGDGLEGSNTKRIMGVIVVLLFLIMDTTVNVIQPAALLLVSDFAGYRQTTGNALATGWSMVGSLIVPLYNNMFGAAYLSNRAFFGMIFALMFISCGIACWVGKEEPLCKYEMYEGYGVPSTWSHLRAAFGSIVTGIRTLPGQLFVYFMICFFSIFGALAYESNQGPFFGYEVLGGDATNADTCEKAGNCTDAQELYNKGVAIGSGQAMLLFCIVGYLYTWVLPTLVRRFGAKKLLSIVLIPQSLLMVMAFSKNVGFNVILVGICATTQTTVFSLMIPTLVHVFGPKAEIGMYYGALNSSNCIGQFLVFILSSPMVQTSLRFKFPVLLGGVSSFFAIIVAIFFYRIQMYSL